jgi:DNA recombination-dependent growth factor C
MLLPQRRTRGRTAVGLLSQSVSVTRYHVRGRLKDPVLETIGAALGRNTIRDIDSDVAEKTSGWTSFDKPFSPDFAGSDHIIGPYLVFSLRVDKKSIPPKIVTKHCTIEEAKRQADSARRFFSRSEKKMVKEAILHSLCLRIPATPHVYDLVWHYEEGRLWFFSNLKAANEELETLFSDSFDLSLIRIFPYTAAEIDAGLSNSEIDRLNQLTPALFTG